MEADAHHDRDNLGSFLIPMEADAHHDRDNPPRLSFLILSHEQPAQVSRLISTLTHLYDRPLIVCHHDTRRSAPPAVSGANLIVLPNPVKTRWGAFSLVNATLRGLEALLDLGDEWTWTTLLSGADYPVAPAAAMWTRLQGDGVDAYMQLCRVDPWSRHVWHLERRRRYFGQRVWLGRVLGRSSRRYVRSVGPERPHSWGLFGPGSRLTCYVGSQWFTANKRAAVALVEGEGTHPQLWRRYQNVFCPDESYFHTLLGNTAGLRVSSDPSRYVDVSGGSPKILTLDDYAAIRESGSWFARKFDEHRSAGLLDVLEQELPG
jgi:Core-2/I-Branching enzyme